MSFNGGSNDSLSLGQPFIQFLSSNGDGSGIINGAQNFSVTPATLFIQPASGQILYLNSFRAAISDNANFNQTDYGAIPGGVTNGLFFSVRLNGFVIDSLEGERIKTNSDWLKVGFQAQLTTFSGISQTLTIDNKFVADFGSFLVLQGKLPTPDRFSVTLSDDFSSLVAHTFIIRGLIRV